MFQETLVNFRSVCRGISESYLGLLTHPPVPSQSAVLAAYERSENQSQQKHKRFEFTDLIVPDNNVALFASTYNPFTFRLIFLQLVFTIIRTQGRQYSHKVVVFIKTIRRLSLLALSLRRFDVLIVFWRWNVEARFA